MFVVDTSGVEADDLKSSKLNYTSKCKHISVSDILSLKVKRMVIITVRIVMNRQLYNCITHVKLRCWTQNTKTF